MINFCVIKNLNFKILDNAKFLIFIFLFEILWANSCVKCHQDYGSLSLSHEGVSCQTCHDGNAVSSDKITSHIGLIANPATLEFSKKRCISCHKSQISRVSITPMQTQNPIKSNLYTEWAKHGKSLDLNSTEILSIAKDHHAKACAGCHVSQNSQIYHNKNLSKGGGCAACHKISNFNGIADSFFDDEILDFNEKKKIHTKYSTTIPSKNCVQCHNRSARIGFAYFGKFESEGSKAPFDRAHTLADGRHYHQIDADVHYKNAKLQCVDCHTSLGVMGDGKDHANMRDAVVISCEDCHKPKFKAPNDTAKKLLSLNKNIPNANLIAYTKKADFPLYNVVENNGTATLYRKKDGVKFQIPVLDTSHTHLHENLTCSACHEKSMASCFGCHEQKFSNAMQFDWKNSKFSKGAWSEMRSFLRFEEPSLGVRNDGKIANFAPGCQVIATIYDKNVSKFHALSIASWTQHSTGKSKTCSQCHFSSTSLGLGRGVLGLNGDEITFEPTFDQNNFDFGFSLDSFVDVNGTTNQIASKNDRTLNIKEMKKIVFAYRCIVCHDTLNDKIYADFNASKRAFEQKETKCLE